jgi:hypothetical protein
MGKFTSIAVIETHGIAVFDPLSASSLSSLLLGTKWQKLTVWYLLRYTLCSWYRKQNVYDGAAVCRGIEPITHTATVTCTLGGYHSSLTPALLNNLSSLSNKTSIGCEYSSSLAQTNVSHLQQYLRQSHSASRAVAHLSSRDLIYVLVRARHVYPASENHNLFPILEGLAGRTQSLTI